MKKETNNYMYGLKNVLELEEKKLEFIKQKIEKSLANAPKGKIRVSSTGDYTMFFHCTDESSKSRKRGVYITKENRDIIKPLAQEEYDQKMKRVVEKRLNQIQKLNASYYDEELEDIYNGLHPKKQEFVSPYEPSWQQRVIDWKSQPYTGKEFKAGTPEIYTKKGERVRSKSEKLIADTLFDMGIEYKYECPIHLKGYGQVYPDFTILSRKTGKEMYWEHDGRMDDPQYSEKAVKKINTYISNGILPGERLILTFETANIVLNDRIIKKMIDTYLV